MRPLKDRVHEALEAIGYGAIEYKWPAEEPERVMVDCIEESILPLDDTPHELEDFEGLNGLYANAQNWSGSYDEKLYWLIVENDWQSMTLKVDEDFYLKVPKELIYDYEDRDYGKSY